jgi:hypothetical protein
MSDIMKYEKTADVEEFCRDCNKAKEKRIREG